MGKYVYAESTVDYYPQLKTIVAPSYIEAVDKVREKYRVQLEEYPDDWDNLDDWNDLQDFLNENYDISLSDLEDIEEL